LPVVATEVPGNSTVVRDGLNGMLVRNGDAEHLAHRLESVLSDNEQARALGTAARRTILDQYDIRVVADRYRELYRSIIRPGAVKNI
jgi:N,N'-diacetylbacillosaminyl-diphospho-undecaprenol alpha-1,3-N-acetylgalactosaminyltransferase